jgi:plasmid stability protein
MAQILIRNMDESIVEALKELAKEHGRSLQAEALKILERGVIGKTKNPENIAASIRKKLSSTKHSDSTRLIAKDRKR